MRDHTTLYEGYRAVLLLSSLAGATCLTGLGWSARRAALVWLSVLLLPYAAFLASQVLKLPEEGLLPYSFHWVQIQPPLLAACGSLLFHGLRWKPGPARTCLLRAGAALAGGAALGALANAHLLMTPDPHLIFGGASYWIPEAARGLFLGAAAHGASYLLTREPRLVRGAALLPFAALLVVGIWVKARQPSAFWRTQTLIAALDSDPPPLGSCLGTTEYRARQTAAAAALARKGASVVPALREALAKDRPPRIRVGAAMALAALGPVAAPAIPELLAAVADKEWHLPHYAAKAVGAIGPAALPALRAAVAEGRLSSVYAGSALAGMGEAGRAAALAAARDKGREIRSIAVYALDSFPDEEAVRALGRLAEDEDVRIAWAATGQLARLRQKGAAAIPSLVRALKHRGAGEEAAVALAWVEPPGSPRALPLLLQALERPPRYGLYRDDYDRSRLKEVLSALSHRYKGDRRVAAALTKALERERKYRSIALSDYESAVSEQRHP